MEILELRRQLEVKDAEIRELASAKSTVSDELAQLREESRSSKSADASSIDGDSDSDYTSLREHKIQKQIIIARDREIETLQDQLKSIEATCASLKEEAEKYRETFETEKAGWLDEKEKVIRYQKQLQLNYVQMYKRNKTLESDVEKLNKQVADQEKKANEKSEKSSMRYKFFGSRH